MFSAQRSLPLCLAVFLALAGSGCNRTQPQSDSSATSASPSTSAPRSASQEMTAGVTVHAPDAFYDPPANLPKKPGVLLRSEPLKDVTLPPGMQGWHNDGE